MNSPVVDLARTLVTAVDSAVARNRRISTPALSVESY